MKMWKISLDLLLGIVLACIVCPVSAQTTQPCDVGWLPYSGSCYMFNTQQYLTKAGAAGDCFRNDASLLRLSSQDQLTWLLQTAKQFPSDGYWTDLNDNPKTAADRLGTGVWKWGSYQYADLSLIQWNQSPANDGQANCAAVNIQGKLADVKCSLKTGYICKYPITNTGNTRAECASGWYTGTTSCYFFSNVSDVTQLKSWSDAKTVCEGMGNGAKLMVISDQNDVMFLLNELPFVAKTTMTHWVGLKSTTVGQWSWYTGDTFNAALIKWQKEPDNVAGIENCGVLRMTGKFSDRDCSQTANYICYKSQYNTNPVDNFGCGNWIRGGKLCYGFMANGMSKTWADARNYCKSKSSDLIKLDSVDKTSWLLQQLMDPAMERSFWMGLNDQQKEGNYVWADGSKANSSYINWNTEPNDYMGNEDCTVIRPTGQYNDVFCTTTHAAAICELDNLSPCPAGWIANGGNCYLFTPFNNQSALFYTQLQASTYCQSQSPNSNTIGKLLSVDNKAEKAFIKNQISSITDRNNVYGWYTSLNDLASEGFWQFGNTPLLDGTLVDWEGEPSTLAGDNCGVVGFAGAMREINCNTKLPFICERYATGVSHGNGIKGNILGCVITLVVVFFGI